MSSIKVCARNSLKSITRQINISTKMYYYYRNLRTIIIWFLLSSSLAIINVSTGAQYVTPEECTWAPTSMGSLDDSFEWVVECIIRTFNSTDLKFDFKDTEHIISLSVICDGYNLELQLEDSFLSNLRYLKSLYIENCKLPLLTSGALMGLPQLLNLTVRTHSINSLNLIHQSLINQKHLEMLDLGFNYISQLPRDVFCPLTSLKTLNLTHNQLSGFKSFGLIDDATGQLCLQELQRLDLSYNNISFLSESDVASFKSLQALYLQNNKITEIAELSLSALAKLHIIDLSNNLLLNILSGTFDKTKELIEVHLQNNSLSYIPLDIFSGLSKLLILDLSYNHIKYVNVGIVSETFADLIRVVIINLSHNRLKLINRSTFQNQHSLQMLYLNNNEINQIEDNSFDTLYNLQTLILKGNRLKYMFRFNCLYNLSELSVAENQISYVDDTDFNNCSHLRDLKLNGNLLSEVPKVISSLTSLKTLHLNDNRIKTIKSSSFDALQHLNILNLSGNQINNINTDTLKGLNSLKLIDLSMNRINNLDYGVFDNAPTLISIKLQNNLLTDINGVFINLYNLQYINVSNNKITWFDYALIPISLTKLDIHNNEIETLGNYFDLESTLHLQEFDVSYNQIKEINTASIPNSIERLNLSNNKIRVINQFSFMAKHNISFVDLRNNSIQSLNINAFHLKTITINKQLPEFYISFNPYVCDCTMDRMRRINNLDTRRYPYIVDMDQVMCQSPQNNQLLPLTKANSSNFLCEYKFHCFALCHCCDLDSCDCETICPMNCTCYHDQVWNTNIIDCSARAKNSIPLTIPMNVTALYLDGNDISTLTSDAFIGRKNMKTLYLNNSNIYNISDRTFNGLAYLEVLHLEYNQLSVLHSFTFYSLQSLIELHLNHNRIHNIQNNTFVHLKSLQILHLEYNSIIEFQNLYLNLNQKIVALYLSNNLWSCNCQVMNEFQDWLRVFGNSVIDFNQIRCAYNSSLFGPYIWNFNSSSYAQLSSSSDSSIIIYKSYSTKMDLIISTLYMIIYNRDESQP